MGRCDDHVRVANATQKCQNMGKNLDGNDWLGDSEPPNTQLLKGAGSVGLRKDVCEGKGARGRGYEA